MGERVPKLHLFGVEAVVVYRLPVPSFAIRFLHRVVGPPLGCHYRVMHVVHVIGARRRHRVPNAERMLDSRLVHRILLALDC